MLRLFFKKEYQIQSLMQRYLDELKLTKEHFLQALNSYFDKGLCEEFDFLLNQTHKAESEADDVRYEIETLMYSKALIPESRGDILGLLEALDRIPGLFQLLLYMMQNQKLKIPDFLVQDIRELTTVTLACCDLLCKEVEALFKKTEDIKALVQSIDTNESRCDHIERQIISKIFDSDLDPFEKLQLKEVVIAMGDISDQADRVSRRIYIISIKRRV